MKRLRRKNLFDNINEELSLGMLLELIAAIVSLASFAGVFYLFKQ